MAASKSRRRRHGASNYRLVAVVIVLVAAWGGIGFRLFQVQVVRASELAAQGLEQRLTKKVLAADRGTIFDRQSRELAVTVPGTTVYANPRQIENPKLAARLLAAVLDAEEDDMLERLRRDSSFVYLKRQLEFSQAEEVRELDLAGVYFLEEPRRVYPAGSMAAAVVGFVNIDNEGNEGLEYQYEEVLRGQPGTLLVETDPSGRVIPQGQYQVEPAEPGSDLVTTLDLDIQFSAESACSVMVEKSGAARCTVVVLQPETGEVLAMAVIPTFDPGRRDEVDDPDVYQNAAVRSTYEPGSTLKLVTVAAALEEGVVRPDTLFPGVPYEHEVVPHACDSDRDDIYGCFTDFKYHEPADMTVKEIVTASSNVGTILIGERLGDAALRHYLSAFALGVRTRIDFSGEAAGAVNVDPTCGSCAASAAIGYSVAVTPLQMAAAYGAIANDGIWIQPHLVEEIVDGEGRVRPVRPARHQVVSSETARTMRILLENVVEEGTGVAAQVPGFSVAGKTGTAERSTASGYDSSSNVASFVGMAPADDPKLVVAVVVDAPSFEFRTGGLSAAPVFAEVMEKALHRLGVGPDAL